MTTLDQINAQLDVIHTIRLEDYPRMIELAEETLTASRDLDYPPGIARSLNYLAWAYNRQYQYPKAVKPAQEGLLIAQQYDLLEEEAYAHCNMVLIHDFSEQLEACFESSRRQLQIAQQLDHNELMAIAHQDLATLHIDRGEFGQASDHYQQCLALASTPDLYYLKGLVSVNFAEIYLKQKNIPFALAKAHEGLDYLLQSKFYDGVASAVVFIANIHIDLGDLESASSLLRYLKPASIDLTMLQAKMARKQGDHQEAIRLINQLLTSLDTTDPNKLTVHRQLADMYAETGDYRSAFHWSEEATKISKNLYDQQIANRIEVVNALHELDTLKRALAERQRTENERMERQRAELELRQQQKLAEIKRELLIRMSHEFRTPLAIIRTSIDLLNRYSDKMTPEKKVYHNEKIDAQYVVLEQLLDDILEVLRTDDVSMPFDNQPLYPDSVT